MITSGGRRGAMVIALAFVGLILGAGVFVMALSTQASAARSAQAAALVGRYAQELAESAVDETLSEFTAAMDAVFRGADLRADWMSKSSGALALTGEQISAQPITWFPERTVKIAESLQMGLEVGAVTLKPLTYTLTSNYGLIDISANVTYKLSVGRTLYRRVTSRHYFVLNADQRSLSVNPTSTQRVVDRSPDA